MFKWLNVLFQETLLESENPERRRKAAIALGNLGNTSAADSLIKLLNDKDSDVRKAVFDALRKLEGVKLLIKSLRYDADAAEALGQLGDPSAIESLLYASRINDDPEIRQASVKALIQLGAQKEAVESLIKNLEEDSRFSDKVNIAEALGGLGDKRGVNWLVEEGLRKGDSSVRHSAAEALIEMASSNPAILISQWKKVKKLVENLHDDYRTDHSNSYHSYSSDCGLQKGHADSYFGPHTDINLNLEFPNKPKSIPKPKENNESTVETVISFVAGEFKCPNCDKSLVADKNEKPGMQITCPLCKESIVIPRRSTQSAKEVASATFVTCDFNCPNCDKSLVADENEKPGMEITCPSCRETILIPGGVTNSAKEAVSATFEFQCSNCGQSLESEEKWIGMELECPTCNTTIVVPARPSESSNKNIPLDF